MKFKFLSLSLFSAAAISPFLIPSLTPSAQAGCVAVDVNTQVAVDGQRRGNQRNNVNQEFGPNCENSVGGVVRSRSTQVCVTDGTCEQNRESNQFVDGDSNRQVPVRTRNIGIQVDVPVHIQKPKVPSRR